MELYTKQTEEITPALCIGLLLSCSISLILSVDLFSSAGTNWWYKAWYGGIAIALELMKCSVVIDIEIARRSKDRKGRWTYGGLFFVLSLVSIMGSLGSFQRDYQTYSDNSEYYQQVQQEEQQRVELANQQALNHYQLAMSQYEAALQSETTLIENLNREIQENLDAINYYQSIERIQSSAEPLKANNENIRSQIDAARNRINKLTPPVAPKQEAYSKSEPLEETTMVALAGILASATPMSFKAAHTTLITLVSILLEIATGYFVWKWSKIRFAIKKMKEEEKPKSRVGTDLEVKEEAKDKPDLDHSSDPTIADASESSKTVKVRVPKNSQPKAKPEQVDTLYPKIKRYALETENPSKSSARKKFGIGVEKANHYYARLLQEGILKKNEKGHFEKAS